MGASERPVIGISCAHFATKDGVVRVGMTRDYVHAVALAGGLPVLLPVLDGDAAIRGLLDVVQAVLLAGGGDLDPQRFGEEPLPQLGQVDPERDAFELTLARLALERDMPVLGICRGIQVLNVAAGGTLYQDIATQVPRALMHDQRAPRWYPCHEVRVEEETLLASIFGAETVRVNSFHHQSVKVVAPPFRVSAKARDSVVEAIESREHRFVVGVQWHPECMVERYPAQRQLFVALVEAARGFRARPERLEAEGAAAAAAARRS